MGVASQVCDATTLNQLVVENGLHSFWLVAYLVL